MNLTWQDINFESHQLHVIRKKTCGFIAAWAPKDHQIRLIPLAIQAINLLTTWQALAPEGVLTYLWKRVVGNTIVASARQVTGKKGWIL